MAAGGGDERFEPLDVDSLRRVGLGSDRPRPAVPCPWCGAPFDDRGAFDAHLAAAHGAAAGGGRAAPRRWERLVTWGQGLGYLPLWFVLPANLLLAVWVVTAWWDDVWTGSRGDAWYLAKVGLLVFVVPLPSVLVLSFRVFTKRV